MKIVFQKLTEILPKIKAVFTSLDNDILFFVVVAPVVVVVVVA